MPKYKRQHYVPKFYLRSFGKPSIYCYDKWKDQSIKTTIDNIAVSKGFYDLKGIGHALELALSHLETLSSPAYYELIEKKAVDKLSKETQISLFLFMASQFLRTEENRISLQDITSQSLGIFAKQLGMKIPDEFKITFDDKTIKRMHIESLLEYTPKLAYILYQKKWIVQENENLIPLWTSDNPITLNNVINKGDGNLGLVCEGIEIRFPLSTTLSLVSFDSNRLRLKDNSGKLAEGNVIYDNMLQLQRASRFVYASSDNDFERARRFVKEYPQIKSPYRQRNKVYHLKGKKDGSGYDVM